MSILSVMATTTEEVTVSMEEVMVVKSKDDNDSDDADKAQVILQLQPITVAYVTIRTDFRAVELNLRCCAGRP